MGDTSQKAALDQGSIAPAAGPAKNEPANSGSAPAKGAKRFLPKWADIAKAIVVLTGFGGLLFAVVKYFDQRSLEIQQRNHEAKEAQDQRAREFLWQAHTEMKETLNPLCEIVGEIVSARKLKDADAHIHRFWVLYFGLLHIIEDPDLSQAEIEFVNALQDANPEEGPSAELVFAARRLTEACQRMLALPRDKVFPPESAGAS
jgi:hypothetical protein